jgi:hypothetical protein
MSVLEFALVLFFLFSAVGLVYWLMLADVNKVQREILNQVQAVVDDQNRQVNQVTGNLYDRLSKLEVAAAQKSLRAVDKDRGN